MPFQCGRQAVDEDAFTADEVSAFIHWQTVDCGVREMTNRNRGKVICLRRSHRLPRNGTAAPLHVIAKSDEDAVEAELEFGISTKRRRRDR